MRKNRAAIEILKVQIPAGYGIGGQSLASGVDVGKLTIRFSTDNPWLSGQVLEIVDIPVEATGEGDEWKVEVDYALAAPIGGTAKPGVLLDPTNTTGTAPKLTHTISLAQPTAETPGTMILTMARPTVDQVAQNRATETWTLTFFAQAGGGNLIFNPSVKKVYRWLAEEQSTIQVEGGFDKVAGKQAVIIKPGTSSSSSSSPTQLAFLVQPTNTAAGAAIPEVKVEVRDASGNPVTTATNNITLAIGANAGVGTLSGTFTSVPVSGGIATFSNLSIDTAATGYTLTASATDLQSATSAAFAVTTNTAPSVNITSFSVTNADLITTAATATDPDEADGNLILTWTLTDLFTPFDSFTINGNTTALASFNLTTINSSGPIPDGLYRLTVSATDSSGAATSDTDISGLKKTGGTAYTKFASSGVVTTPSTITGLKSESGNTRSFVVTLVSTPSADVTVVLTSSSGQGLLQKAGDGDIPKLTETIVLTIGTATTGKTITVVGQSTTVAPFTISLTTTSSDTNFDGIAIPVAVSVN